MGEARALAPSATRHAEYLTHLARESRRLEEIARRPDVDASVPTCPQWNLRDLLTHVGNVHRWFTLASREPTDGPPDFPSVAPSDDASLAAWLRVGAEELVAVLIDVDPDAPRWTWFEPDQTAGWYVRRASQETLMHRIDAELAVGPISDVDVALAVDGIDEMCDVFIPDAAGEPVGGDGRTLQLHAVDADADWWLTLHADRVQATREPVTADAELRGSARDLLLAVWGRDPIAPLERVGDEAVIATFRAASKID